MLTAVFFRYIFDFCVLFRYFKLLRCIPSSGISSVIFLSVGTPKDFYITWSSRMLVLNQLIY